jgi:signal transduction histidine kinase
MNPPPDSIEGLPGPAHEKILVVDDDQLLCRSIQAIFARVGLESSAVHSVAAAKTALREDRYGLVLLDLNMPGAEGTELLQHINQEKIGCWVIVVSGERDVKKAIEVMKQGARDFLRKPYNPEELLITVQNTLTNRNLEIQNRRLVEALRMVEMQRKQSQKIESLGRLAGGIAHDFNNMLSAIMGNVELALTKLHSGSQAQKHLLRIKDVTQRSVALTGQLLSFARKQPIVPQVMNLNLAVAETLHLLRRLIGEDMELVWVPAPGDARVRIDPSQLNQILTNLVVNARDAIETTGSLKIQIDCLRIEAQDGLPPVGCQPGNYVALTFKDDGCGMSPEVQAQMFEPFYTTKEEEKKGTGLGLSTVYGIVTQNDGFIRVESEPGRGATIRIYLPESREVISSRPLIPGVQARGGEETILLVEDETMLLEIFQTYLEADGYRVIATSQPELALHLVQDQKIDLLVTDVIMPKLNGKELAGRLLATRPDLKVIYMSGYESGITSSRGLLDDGVELLAKPLTHSQLSSRVREVLDRNNFSSPKLRCTTL